MSAVSSDSAPQPAKHPRRAYIFFSVHEELFHRVALRLRERGIEAFSGFVWGRQQERALKNGGVDYESLVVFTRDLLPQCDDGARADLVWLAQRERELGISIERKLASERHLLRGRSYDQIMRMAEVALRAVAESYDRTQPDFVVSEDISCFHSYVHFAIARERGIPFWCIGNARLPNRLSVYSAGMQHWERVETLYQEIRKRGLSPTERSRAETFVHEFRSRPRRPVGMDRRAAMPRVGVADMHLFNTAIRRYFGDRRDPTVFSPLQLVRQRLERMVRIRVAEATDRFDQPVPGERYILYPIHFQPEATTLVQAPLYLDQVALLRDIARSLPIGHRLYVKEHVSNRGRRPMSFYDEIRAIPAVRLLGPDVDTWTLIKQASAVAVITGTMGWEGLLFGKPVVSFGDIFYNMLPHVYRASQVPKDRWFDVFSKAISDHVEDGDALLALVAAMHEGSYPGMIRNPRSFPEVLEDKNVEALAAALASAAGLAP